MTAPTPNSWQSSCRAGTYPGSSIRGTARRWWAAYQRDPVKNAQGESPVYVAGIVGAMVVALVLRRTVTKGQTPGFMMEMPKYQMPSWRDVLLGLWQRALIFLKRKLLLPISRWLYEYSLENFRRQQRVNRMLFACIEELAIENAKLKKIRASGE